MPGNGKVFISHTHADNARCEPLLAALDAWGVEYWFDAQQLDAGQQLTPRLQEAIVQHDVLLRVCTANTSGSYWMNLELSAFRAAQYQERRQRPEQRKCIDLILDVGYTPGALERAEVTVDATNTPPHIWLAELAAPLGVTLTGAAGRRGVSRRALLGLGGAAAITAAAIGSGAAIVTSRNAAANAPFPKPKTVSFTNPQTLDPRIKWYFKAGGDLGIGLALAGDNLMLSTDDGFFGLNAADGSIRWFQGNFVGNTGSMPIVVGSTAYLATNNVFSGVLAAFNSVTGSIIWKVATNSTLGDTNFSLSQNAIYILSDDNFVVCFNAQDGSKRWQSPIKIAVSGLADRAPVASDTAIYIGGADGVLTALSLFDGSQLWTYQTGGDIGAGVALGPGVVYVASQDQHLYALNAADGSRIWRYTSDIALGAPTVAGAVLYLGIADQLTAIAANTGAQLWQAQATLDGGLSDTFFGSVTVAGDTLYAPAGSYLYAFSAQKRAALWRFQSQMYDDNQWSPIVVGSTIYWPAANHTLYALDATATA